MISKEQRKKYNETFHKNHQNDKFHCEECNKDYSIFNKSHHINSKKHILNSLKSNKIESLEDLKKKLNI